MSNNRGRRLNYWLAPHFASTQAIYSRASESAASSDYFAAYLFLFIAFNNLYSLNGSANASQQDQIRAEVDRLTDKSVRRIYSPEYLSRITWLNSRRPHQHNEGPDEGRTELGIVNMLRYLRGAPVSDYVVHIDKVASLDAPAGEMKETLADVASKLLYAVRNNQFHAVKGPHEHEDREVLEHSYHLLRPIVEALPPMNPGRDDIARL